MRTHRFEAVSLLFGLIFTAAGLWFLTGRADVWQLDWSLIWPALLILAGAMVLLSLRSGAETPRGADLASDEVALGTDDLAAPDRGCRTQRHRRAALCADQRRLAAARAVAGRRRGGPRVPRRPRRSHVLGGTACRVDPSVTPSAPQVGIRGLFSLQVAFGQCAALGFPSSARRHGRTRVMK